MVLLQIPLSEFWDYTPIEIGYALKAYRDKEAEFSKNEWERTRTHVYYEYLFVQTRRRKVSYNTFKKDYLKLWFDEERKVKEVMDDNTFAEIHDYFKKLKGAN